MKNPKKRKKIKKKMINNRNICNTSYFSSKYKEIKLLGEGSYGTAILVRSLIDKSLLVIKQIDLTKLTPEKRDIAFKEAEILEGLNHKYIIHFREFYVNNNLIYIIMDYADGGDLSMKIKKQRELNQFFSEETILNYFTQICLAIKYIHDRKILHRDIKSQNIFLTKNNYVKLGDFGIAKCLETTLDKAKTLIGTPYYLSPEIINDQPYDFSSDIWALGVLLYEICCLKMPFEGTNLPQLYMKIANGNYPPLNNKNLSKELKNLVASLLNVNPKLRPNIHQILDIHIIQKRIKNFLSESEFKNEFPNIALHNVNYLKESNSKIHELKNNNKFIRNGSKRDDKLTVSNSSYNNNNNNNINCYNYKNKDKDKEREIYILKKDLMSNNNNSNNHIQKINNRVYLNSNNNNKIENNLYNYHKGRPESEKRKIEYNNNNNNYINPISKNIKKEHSERILRHLDNNSNSKDNSTNNSISNQESKIINNIHKINYERNKGSKDKNQLKNIIDQIQNPMNEINQFLENQNLKNSFSKYSNSSKKLEEKKIKNEKDNINDFSDLYKLNVENEIFKNESFDLNNNEENDISNLNYIKQIGSTNSSSINESNIDQNIINELNSELGKDTLLDMANIIKKNMNDEMISYDYEKIIIYIKENYKKKDLPKIAIDRAINKIPDIYFLIIRGKL